MSNTPLRTGMYSLIALVFGIIEWFHPLINFMPPEIVRSVFVYGVGEYLVWLIALILVLIYETTFTTNICYISLQATMFLFTALIGYYFSYFYDVVILDTNPLLSHFKIGNPGWGMASLRFFVNDVLPEFIQWSAPTIVFGIGIGCGVSKVRNLVREKRRRRDFAE